MTVRILADREPYIAFPDERDPIGSFVILNGPAALDEAPPDILVLPAEDFLTLSGYLGSGILCIPYGPVSLMERAFERGCADFLREPWSLPELRARGIRLFRQEFRIGETRLKLRGRQLIGENASIVLGESERALLRLCILNAPFPVPKELALVALSRAAHPDARTLGRYATSLRRKMDLVEPGLGKSLLTIRGFGYRLGC